MNDEDAFLQAIRANPNDEQLRLVYADWLEEQGDPRAEYLRLDAALAAQPYNPTASEQEKIRRVQLRDHLGMLRQSLNGQWLILVARSDIENCSLSSQDDCPRNWDRLSPTSNESIRFCQRCGQNVYYCTSIEQARQEVGRGWRVAVDARLPRSRDDLHLLTYPAGEPSVKREVEGLPRRPSGASDDEKRPPYWQAQAEKRRCRKHAKARRQRKRGRG
ncbi:MAG: TIGR02996 domain-containing protein [Gemmataceae bacterium]|nr:TIGR02996 domain-containing protein [Gemmataceae bacterium]